MVRISNKKIPVKVDNMTWEIIKQTQKGTPGFSSVYEFPGIPTGSKIPVKCLASSLVSSGFKWDLWVFVMGGV